MVPALPPVRPIVHAGANRDRSAADLDERCFQCNRYAYSCEGWGERSVSGFICIFCIRLMDGHYRARVSGS